MVRFDIDVLLIVPGLTRSDYFGHLLRNEGRMKIQVDKGMPPEEMAAGILKALVKNRTETVLGWEARWILRVNRFFPRLVDRLLARKVRQAVRGRDRAGPAGSEVSVKTDSRLASSPAGTRNPAAARALKPVS